jgi:hypothetical protein
MDEGSTVKSSAGMSTLSATTGLTTGAGALFRGAVSFSCFEVVGAGIEIAVEVTFSVISVAVSMRDFVFLGDFACVDF